MENVTSQYPAPLFYICTSDRKSTKAPKQSPPLELLLNSQFKLLKNMHSNDHKTIKRQQAELDKLKTRIMQKDKEIKDHREQANKNQVDTKEWKDERKKLDKLFEKINRDHTKEVENLTKTSQEYQIQIKQLNIKNSTLTETNTSIAHQLDTINKMSKSQKQELANKDAVINQLSQLLNDKQESILMDRDDRNEQNDKQDNLTNATSTTGKLPKSSVVQEHDYIPVTTSTTGVNTKSPETQKGSIDFTTNTPSSNSHVPLTQVTNQNANSEIVHENGPTPTQQKLIDLSTNSSITDSTTTQNQAPTNSEASRTNDQIDQTISVPPKLAGIIIGKQRHRANRIENNTNIKMKIAKTRNTDLKITLTGTPVNINNAKTEISKLLRCKYSNACVRSDCKFVHNTQEMTMETDRKERPFFGHTHTNGKSPPHATGTSYASKTANKDNDNTTSSSKSNGKSNITSTPTPDTQLPKNLRQSPDAWASLITRIVTQVVQQLIPTMTPNLQ